MGGVFSFVGTHGIPLEFVLEYMKGKGWVVDWPLYVEESTRQGAKMRTVRSRVMSAVGEVYGPFYVRRFKDRWEEWFGE